MEVFNHANDDSVVFNLLWHDGDSCTAFISLDDYVDIFVIYIMFDTVFLSDLFIYFAMNLW